MAKFNAPAVNRTKTTNVAGGEAFKQPAKVELVSHLLTSFVKNDFYRSQDDGTDRLKQLLTEVDPKFAAKAAIYARNEFGMRSVSHVLAGQIGHSVKGEQWTKNFFDLVVRRPDDMTEIMAYYMGNHGKPVPNAIKKGLAKAFGKFDTYQLAKYRGEGRDVSLVDVANIVHPRPTEKNAEALNALINGKLRSKDTWEAKLSDAGKKADSDEAKDELKKDAWAELIRSRKIGYFALLRNLRNIMEQAPEVLDEACALLEDRKLIKNSLVLPFRYLTAYTEIRDSTLDGRQKVLNSLSRAIDISVDNVPKFDGRTLVALDTSSSMLGNWYAHRNGAALDTKAPAVIGSVFMAALLRGNPGNTDLMLFEGDAQYIRLDANDSTLSLSQQIVNKIGGGSTNTPQVFNRATKKYDRVIILSDMQTWRDASYGYAASSGVTPAYNAYRTRLGITPTVYTWDLAGLGTSNLSRDKIYEIAGFSEKVLDMMKLLEQDRNALVNTIDGYCDL